MNDEQFAAILASMTDEQRTAVVAAVASTVWSVVAMIATPEVADTLADQATETFTAHLDTLIGGHRQ